MNEALPQNSQNSSNGPTLVIGFFIVLFLVIAAAGILYYLYTQDKSRVQPQKQQPAIPTVPQTATPTLSPSPVVLERSTLQIAVLNGSGTVGAARGISTRLTELGYTIKTIGNANGFAYQDITILIKKDKEAYLSQLQKDLEADTSVSSISATVDDTIPVDAEVIVGR